MSIWNPLTWLRWVSQFIQSWLLSIPWRDAPKALPAVILSLVLFATGFIAFSGGAGWRNRLLDRQLAISLERDDFETAEIVVRRQLEADPQNSDLVYRFAQVRDAQGEREEATLLMRRLLKRRHLPATSWLLQNGLVGKKWTDLSEEELDDAGKVLGLIASSEPENLAIKKMLAEYYIFNKQIVKSIPLLDELSDTEPTFGLQAAALARSIGDQDGAKRFARKSLERVEEMLKDDPDNALLGMHIARNQIFLENHSGAIRTLQNSLKRVRTQEDGRMLTQALGDAIVTYINHIERSPTETLTEKMRVLRMLDVAIKIAPNNPRVVTMVADHVLANLDEEDAELVTVRESLVQGSPLGISHFIKGTASLMGEDLEMAELHLGEAAKAMPQSGAILNNLAVALALKDPPDLERALQVSEEAINQVPNPTPHFFETRGQILYRLGRFRESIGDLERALAEPSLAPKAHQMLADCYDKAGDSELAEGHRRAVSRLKKKGVFGEPEQAEVEIIEDSVDD